jgi:hypothetical protein
VVPGRVLDYATNSAHQLVRDAGDAAAARAAVPQH